MFRLRKIVFELQYNINQLSPLEHQSRRRQVEHRAL